MQFGFVCAKYILFVFNFFLWLVGCALLAVGIWYLVDPNSFVVSELANIVRVSAQLMKGAAIILVVVGGLLFLVAGLGCCGACKENYECIMGYAALVAILIIAQIVAGILAGIFYNQILTDSKQQFNSSLYKYGQFEVDTGAWNFVQTNLECCGVDSYKDWITAKWNGSNAENPVPISCCKLTSMNSANIVPVDKSKCMSEAKMDVSSATQLNGKGCDPTFRDWMKSKAAIIIGVAIGVIVVQILVLLASCCLAQRVKNDGNLA